MKFNTVKGAILHNWYLYFWYFRYILLLIILLYLLTYNGIFLLWYCKFYLHKISQYSPTTELYSETPPHQMPPHYCCCVKCGNNQTLHLQASQNLIPVPFVTTTLSQTVLCSGDPGQVQECVCMCALAVHCTAGWQQVMERHVRCEVEPEPPETEGL